jgi:hypothetical protein
MAVKKKINLGELKASKHNYVSDWEISQMMQGNKDKEEKGKQKNVNQKNDLHKKI